uniref:AT-hook containing transcription factor 1 n=1 Tax=Calidris pygmaea TaxID=425635 RepID=A0A8C3JB52_9CHAR
MIVRTVKHEGDVVSLHLLQLAFGDRKRLASGQVMYEGLEYCDERYSLDFTGGVFPLRGQTRNTKLISCQTVEKFRNHVDREDSINEVISPETSVSIFSWQVNTYGQETPSTYLGVFDINRWYHAQMPDSLSVEGCQMFIVSADGTCLLNSGVVHMTCTGFQKETLNFLKKSGPLICEAIPDSYSRCLVAGLLSPRLVDVQPSSLSQEEQLEAVLSAAVQTGSLEVLTGCIKHWTSEEQPSSAASLRFVLEWTWNKVISTKDEFDQICVPLFDGSCNFIDPQTLQSLQRCQLLLSNLSTVLNCFLIEAQELTQKGFAELTNKRVVTSLISLYVQVVIWFCRSGLLPEGSDDNMHLSRPFYNYPLIQSYYTGHRQKLERLSRGKWDSDCLMVDGMVSQLGDQAEKLWQRDEGGTGKYPPASLHALLDLYLLESIEENHKHAITIYLLLDIMHSFPNKTETSIDSFPTAFAIPWGLVKLVQGFWLLDHNDYENSLALLFHPATIKTVSWQHKRIIQSLMCQGEHRQALRYLQMTKPSVSSRSEVQLFLTVLLSNRCMVEAWGLLHQRATKLNIEELLKHMYETCQEMGLMEDLLKLPFTDTEQDCLEKFLRTSASVQNQEFLLVHHLQRANYIPALELNQSINVNLMNDRDPRLRERAVARNSILDQYGKILPRVQRKLAAEKAKPYHLPSSLLREVSRPKPLSTVAKPANAGNVHTRATFISNVLTKIGEVWAENEQKTRFSQGHRFLEHSMIFPRLYIYFPLLIASLNRLLDLVVRPVPSCTPAQGGSWQSPCRASTSFMASSPLKSNMHGSIPQKNFSGAPELNLLQTPLVVKRAKVLATSASGVPGFTPQSILRSSLRTTPLATPSASPGRSVTPPLRPKEPGISSREENSNTTWTAGVTEDDRALSGPSSEDHHHHDGVVEDAWSGSRRKTTLFTLSNPEDDHAELEESSESTPGDGLEKMEVSKENSNMSARSDQTTLEYHDAKSLSDFEDDVIFIAAKPAHSATDTTASFQESEREGGSEMVEDKPFQMEQPDSSELRKIPGVLLLKFLSSFLFSFSYFKLQEYSAGKAQTSKEAPETSPHSEQLHPLGNLQYRYDAIEHQFACDLPDDKDDECDAAEADGELFISQSNFTLVLEGEEGEGEMGDPKSVDASKPTGTTPEGKPVNSVGSLPETQEQVTNSVSTVTNDQESQNSAESLPYVPEPIKVAIAENLLDVIKDTRSKEFTSEAVEQSIHETIGRKGARLQKAKAALTMVPEGVEDETSIPQEEYVSTPRTRTRGQLSRSLSIPSAGAQQLLSTRRTKEASETSSVVTEGTAPGEQIPVMPVTPRRGRKPKPTNLEKVDRSGIATSAASKRTRGGKSSAGDEGTGQTDADPKMKMAVSPSRSARKQKSDRLKFTETIVKDQEVQPSDLLAVPTKRGRRRQMSTSEVSENSDLDLPKSSLPPTEFKLPVTPRRSARKGARNLLADPEPLSTQEGTHSGGKVEILATPRRSARRVPRGKPEGRDTREQTPAQPNEELSTPRTTVRTGRRGRKRRSILEEGPGEEAFPQGPGGSPLLLEDINPSGHDETSRTVPDRVTRTRSHKTAARQKLPVEEKESFLFSPPLTKLTKKCQAGEADHPVQLKDLDPDLSSQFVFSPPLLRSRRKTVSSISRIAKEPEEDTKSIESVGKQKLKRGRTAKSKVKKSSSWSPPSVEIKFISPFGSPVDGTKSKQKETGDVAEKTLRKNKKRLSNFPKPVVRRKML